MKLADIKKFMQENDPMPIRVHEVSGWNDGYEYTKYVVTLRGIRLEYVDGINHHRHFGNTKYKIFRVDGVEMNTRSFGKILSNLITKT